MNIEWNDKVFQVAESNFEQLSLEIFHLQYQFNSIYRDYVDMLKIKPENVTDLSRIPFLPIQFFKTHTVRTNGFNPEIMFESSGTSQSINSRHYVKDIALYRQSFLKTFELFYGPVSSWCIIALLPSYLERKNSSLVFMVDELIRQSKHSRSGFYLYDHEKLYETLKTQEASDQRTLFMGVSFALLDFAEKYSLPLKQTIVMETGGMKGRREEIVRDDLHEFLKNKFKVDVIHSEYGMTELLSQAYSKEAGIFRTPPWMKVLMRDEEDPLTVQSAASSLQLEAALIQKNSRIAGNGLLFTNDSRARAGDVPSVTGAINIIDLANIYSCSFIATDDAGKLYPDGSFEVLGRLDNSDIRGCSLMMM
jgi:hypothetical protein